MKGNGDILRGKQRNVRTVFAPRRKIVIFRLNPNARNFFYPPLQIQKTQENQRINDQVLHEEGLQIHHRQGGKGQKEV